MASVTVIFLSAFEYDLASTQMINKKGEEIEGETFTIQDIDGKEVEARWPGARSDPHAVQSGVFRAGAQMTMHLKPKRPV